MNESNDNKQAVNDHITAVREAKIREAGKRETAYLQVTTVALVLSVSFITISGFDVLASVGILIWAWISLLIAVIARLLAFTLVDQSFKKNEKDVRDWVKAGMPADKVPDETNRWTKIVQAVNFLSTCTTIVGLVLLVLFGINNVLHMNDENKKINGNESNEPTQKHAEPTISAPSLSDRLNTTTPAVPPKQDGGNSKE